MKKMKSFVNQFINLKSYMLYRTFATPLYIIIIIIISYSYIYNFYSINNLISNSYEKINVEHWYNKI